AAAGRGLPREAPSQESSAHKREHLRELCSRRRATLSKEASGDHEREHSPMTIWAIAAGVLMVGGLVPAMVLACRGPAAHRLVGLELAGATATILMVVLCQAFN